MRQEDTKQRILDKALELFAAYGYDSVSVGDIAKAVGIRAPSLYNHFPGKQAIFDAIVESTAARYEADTDKIDIHVQDSAQDIPVFTGITEDFLFEKVRQIFEYSLHNESISRFRRRIFPPLPESQRTRSLKRCGRFLFTPSIMRPFAISAA